MRTILASLERAFPDPRLELDFSTPFELLVALILAARSPDALVNAVTPELFRRFPRAADLANADPAVLEKLLARVNFYRTKAKGIRETCRALLERFHGEVPSTLEELLTLPRVGRKTANVLLANAFGQDVIGVDTHVARLSQRLGLSAETDPDRIEADLMEVVPVGSRVRFTYLMQLHGRRICSARRPDCANCPLAALCPYAHETRPQSERVGEKPRQGAK